MPRLHSSPGDSAKDFIQKVVNVKRFRYVGRECIFDAQSAASRHEHDWDVFGSWFSLELQA